MPSVPHQRLLHEAALMGTEEILRQMPAPYSPALERAIFQAVRQSDLHYVERLDTLSWARHASGEGR
jgi:hypothetical protein